MTRHRRIKRLSAAVGRFVYGLTEATMVIVSIALAGYALAYTLGLLAELAARWV